MNWNRKTNFAKSRTGNHTAGCGCPSCHNTGEDAGTSPLFGFALLAGGAFAFMLGAAAVIGRVLYVDERV